VKLISNSGTDRVIDWLGKAVDLGGSLDVASPAVSVFAFAAATGALGAVSRPRIVLPALDGQPNLLGSVADRAARNSLQSRSLAKRFAEWLITKDAEVRTAGGPVPQGMIVARDAAGNPKQAVFGTVAFTTEGLGITPGNPMRLLQGTESGEEAVMLSQ
jgi:hypothetical protein